MAESSVVRVMHKSPFQVALAVANLLSKIDPNASTPFMKIQSRINLVRHSNTRKQNQRSFATLFVNAKNLIHCINVLLVMEVVAQNGCNVPIGMLFFITVNICYEIKSWVYEPSRESFKGAYSLRFKTMIQKSEWYRLVTSHFVHSGPFHLLSNSIGAYILGTLYERKYGAGRLIEATIWCILTGTIWVILAMICFPTWRMYDVPILGFSEVLYFWLGLWWTGEEFGISAPRILVTDICGLFEGDKGSIFHLGGFVNGAIYAWVIRPRCSVPSLWLKPFEDCVYFLNGLICRIMLLQEGTGPYLVGSAPM